MDNKLKHRFCRICQTSISSCRTKNIFDIVEQPIFFPENQHHRQSIDLFSPKPQPIFSLICKPKLSQSQHTYEDRPKFSNRNNLLVIDSSVKETDNSRNCSPASPITTPNNDIFYQQKPEKSRKHKHRSRKTNRKSEANEFLALITAKYYARSWYSSDEDDDDHDDETTLFSSKSLSSDSLESFRKHKARLGDKRAEEDGRNVIKPTNAKAVGEGNGRLTDSFAVVKKSSNPHNDFRKSMVEMIVVKHILGAQELENLLECFLSLNSDDHHSVIVEVFSEILETLFSDSC